jgi:Spy/CpxP family protein refolding chaperone
MSRILSCLLVACFATASARAQTSAKPASTTTETGAKVDDVIQSMRLDLQSSRADIMAKNMTLTAEQASKFWPVFDAYQKEQNGIIEGQLRDIKKYVESYDTLSDAGALALMQAHFTRDTKMNNLRQKWLGEFQKVLPTKLAVRAMQIDRRLSLAAQTEVTSRIPLVH